MFFGLSLMKMVVFLVRSKYTRLSQLESMFLHYPKGNDVSVGSLVYFKGSKVVAALVSSLEWKKMGSLSLGLFGFFWRYKKIGLVLTRMAIRILIIRTLFS